MAAIEFHQMRKKAMEEARKEMLIEKQKKLQTISTQSIFLDLSMSQRIIDVPSTIIYKQNVLPQQTCDEIVSFCENRSSWEVFGEWGNVGGRSVMILGGIAHPNGAIVEDLPPLFKTLASSLKSQFNGKSPNQVLLNSYEVGQGIAHHNDGALYQSQVAIISLQSSAKIDFRKTNIHTANTNYNETSTVDTTVQSTNSTTDKDTFSIFLHPNSLLIFGDSAYTEYTHGIEPTSADFIDHNVLNVNTSTDLTSKINTHIPREGKRYSLTFRMVENVVLTLDEFGTSCSEEMSVEVKRRKAWWLHAITEK